MEYLPKVGVLSPVVPKREFDDATKNFRNTQDKLDEKSRSEIIEKLKTKEINILDSEMVSSKDDSIKATKRFISKGIELLVISLPGWAHPSNIAMASRIAAFSSIPTMLIAPSRITGPCAAKGALNEIGATFEAVYGSLEEDNNVKKVVSYAKAASVVSKLRGMTYGLIGGRAMGMYTAVVDPSYWLKVFGIDIDHVDQSEILRLSKKISEKRVDKLFKWLENNCEKIDFNEGILTTKILRKQISGYLAIKEISESNNFDFVGVKCAGELSEHFCSQCIAAGLMNDPYDDENLIKPTTVMACEADANGALSMEILKLLSGGKPVLFMDLMTLNEKENIVTCMNCGGMSTWYANRSEIAKDNLSKVRIAPFVFGKAGGGCISYTAKSLDAVTWMRLSRVDGKYKMIVARGKFVDKKPDPNIPAENIPWPKAHVKFNFNPKTFIEEYDSQHAHIVEGDFVEDCKYIGKLFKMDVKVFI